METRTIRQKVEFKASAHEVYEALMDSKKHSSLSGAEANIGRKEGEKFTAYDGSICGKNIEIVPDKLIVQEWYCETEGWPEGHFSRLRITLKEKKGGCTLEMEQTGVPEAAYQDISEGWKEYYWEPMKRMFRVSG